MDEAQLDAMAKIAQALADAIRAYNGDAPDEIVRELLNVSVAVRTCHITRMNFGPSNRVELKEAS